MNFIVGVQVYQVKEDSDEYPLIIAAQGVNVVTLNPGEERTVAQMANFAIQIFAETHRKKTETEIRETGNIVAAGPTGTGIEYHEFGAEKKTDEV